MKTFLIGRLTAHRKGRANLARRRNERGAALISTLLISTLLLAAGGALVMTTSLSATNAVDSTAEMQAYYAAEAGMQAALNVLRGNVPRIGAADPLADANKINYRRAVDNPSLSNWLPYNSTHSRVILSSGSYSPVNGTAYSVNIADPDNSRNITYWTAGSFSSTATQTSQEYGTGQGRFRLSYTGHPITSPAVLTGADNYAHNLGSFSIEAIGNSPSATIPNTQFWITINQTAPFAGTHVLVCQISGVVATVAGVTTSTVTISFPSTAFSVNGVGYTISNTSLLLNVLGVTTPVQVSIATPEPRRLLVRAIGFGPRGAQKRLQAMVRRFGFQVVAPAPIVIRGADLESGQTYPTEMTFALGSSAAKTYSGQDNGGNEHKPTVAISLYDWRVSVTGIGGLDNPTVGSPRLSILDIYPASAYNPWPSPAPTPLTPTPSSSQTPPQVATPSFLRTAEDARSFLRDAELAARGMGRYFSGPYSGLAGGLDDPQYTFIDGDCTLDGGAGMLIVTGNLVINGNNDFKGIILVLGNGHVTRTGGGNGNILGSWIVARFNRTSGNFLAPTFDVSGGGNGRFQFDSRWVSEANNTTGRLVLGVSEY